MKKTIITISRETGSGGHTIGVMLAKKLGYQLYDEEIEKKERKQTTNEIQELDEKVIKRTI